MLLIIAIVGTTVAPWQLFFQQSYVIDKRITPRFINYERADLCIGIVIVVLGAAAMFGFSAAVFAGHARLRELHRRRRGGARPSGPTSPIWRATSSPSRSSTRASSGRRPSGWRRPMPARTSSASTTRSTARCTKAKGFYACYAGLMAIAAALVLLPGVPLGLLTEGVQTLAGVLLPSATVFLLLLCNDKDVLGPWVNSKALNVFTSAVIWVLVLLSIILTASVLFPSISSDQIVGVLVGGMIAGSLVGAYVLRARPGEWPRDDDRSGRVAAARDLADAGVAPARQAGALDPAEDRAGGPPRAISWSRSCWSSSRSSRSRSSNTARWRVRRGPPQRASPTFAILVGQGGIEPPTEGL